ncbi:MAG: hypothetical protein JXO48_02170 [Deltaproteobacteria bacterium]|nr:hypothetical protein [Deltaproteobacteria bacterium]
MNKLKIIVGILLIFILGTLAGSLGTQVYMKHRIESFGKLGHRGRTDMLMQRLSSKLELTETQRKEVRQILEESQRKIQAIDSEFRPRIEEIMDAANDRIKEKLNDRQKRQLDRFNERFRKHRMRRPPPPPPPPEQ